MLRRLAPPFLLLALVVLPPTPVQALPPSPQLDLWNEGPAPVRAIGESDSSFLARRIAWLQKRQNRIQWNCYNYGVNVQTFGGNGKGVRAHPGKGKAWEGLGKNITADSMCTKVKNRAVSDSLRIVPWNPGDPIPSPGTGRNLVALGVLAGKKGDGADYHWWRLNGDGSWSHKRGGTPAKTTYTATTGAESTLTDPRDAKQRDGYDLCAFMSVSKANLPNVGTLAAAPVCTPSSGTVLVQSVAPSGLPDPQKVLSPTETSQLMSHLPSFSLFNRVSDPHWVPLPAGQYQGWYTITDVTGYGSIPPDMRVYLGTVEVARAWPDTEGVEYYHDDHGLENYLSQTVLTQPVDVCVNGSTDQPLTACQCSDEALGGGPTATLVSLFEAGPVVAGVQLRWQYGNPLEIAGAVLERARAASGPWTQVASQPQEQDGTMQVVDRDVQLGETYWYQLVVTGANGSQFTAGPIAVVAGGPVSGYVLDPVQPNPSHGAMQFSFALPHPATVRLSVVDLLGRQVALITSGPFGTGRHALPWNGRTGAGAAPPGRYFAHLQVDGRVLVQAFVLTR
jgi:hypothetical protein